LFAKKSTQANGLLTGPSFDGSYGVDTEDIMAIGSIDFGSLYACPLHIAHVSFNAVLTHSLANFSQIKRSTSLQRAALLPPALLTMAMHGLWFMPIRRGCKFL
jgi:hypothetical protein